MTPEHLTVWRIIHCFNGCCCRNVPLAVKGELGLSWPSFYTTDETTPHTRDQTHTHTHTPLGWNDVSWGQRINRCSRPSLRRLCVSLCVSDVTLRPKTLQSTNIWSLLFMWLLSHESSDSLWRGVHQSGRGLAAPLHHFLLWLLWSFNYISLSSLLLCAAERRLFNGFILLSRSERSNNSLKDRTDVKYAENRTFNDKHG